MAKLTYQAWKQTPYAKTKANNPDGDIEKLLAKYKAIDFQWTQGRGPMGRRAVMLRFVLKGHTYRINIETLDADAEDRELMLQAKRAMFWMLKSTLEAATVFFKPEEVLFSFLELPSAGGATMYQIAAPQIDKMLPEDFNRMFVPPSRQLPST